jgi:general secretion pathway protein A
LVVIDDAQNLSRSSLEMIRLLSNLETDQEKLVQILLVGQPELEMELASHDLRQLRSRLAKHVRLNALSLRESLDYTAFRFSVASKTSSEFAIDDAAGKMLWQAAQGIPRCMHIILDRCLYGLMHRGAKLIDPALMSHAIADSQILLGRLGSAKDRPMNGNSTFEPSRLRSQQVQVTPLVMGAAVAVAGLVFSGLWWAQTNSSLNTKQLSLTPSLASVATATSPNAASVEATLNPTVKAANEETAKPAVSASSGQTSIARAAAECADQSDTPIFPGASDPLQIARLKPQTWVLIGERLSASVKTCFDAKQNEYQIVWHAPTVPIVFPAGREVARYQIGLSNFGSLAASEVDGILGSKTTESIRLLQMRLGIEPSGRLDPLTALVLNKVYLN